MKEFLKMWLFLCLIMVLCMVSIIPIIVLLQDKYVDWVALGKSALTCIPILGLVVAIVPVIQWIASKIFNNA